MLFRVLKTINNNIVSCLDENDRECIAMGRGLGFGMRPGEIISESDTEKVFRISDRTNLERAKELFASVPHEQVEICTGLIQYALDTLKRKLSDSIYYTLSDHIFFAIRRVQKGLIYANPLTTEVRLFYPQEYAIGCHALAEIEHRLKIQLPEDEAASIALHLVNAEYDNTIGITMEVTTVLAKAVELLLRHPEVAIDRGSIYYDELIVHLKFLALQLFSHQEEDRLEPALAEMVKKALPTAYGVAQELGEYLTHASGQPLSPEQLTYLTVNLHRAMTGPKA